METSMRAIVLITLLLLFCGLLAAGFVLPATQR
jgi:hypothetical protein